MNLKLRDEPRWEHATFWECSQLRYNTPAGEALTEAMTLVDTAVESGSWHGLGSTYCLYIAVTRPEQSVISIEPDASCFDECVRLYAHEPRMTLLHGRTRELLDKLPAKFDLLVLDGAGGKGEDSDSFHEYLELRERVTRFLFLDDTLPQFDKNAPTLKLALTEGWKQIKGSDTDRQGWALLERI